jgi:hypothetical protein
MRRCLPAFAFVLIATMISAQQADSADKQPEPAEKQSASEGEALLQIELMIVSVAKADAISLIPELKDRKTAEAAHAKVQELIRANKASLVGWPNGETIAGRRMMIGNVREQRYPIEFEVMGAKAKKQAGAGGDAENAPDQPIAPPSVMPTAFETRNTGPSVEATSTLSPDGQSVECKVQAQNVTLPAWDEAPARGAADVIIPQPRFHSNQVTADLRLPLGERVLIGSFMSGTNPGEMELFLLKVNKRPER